MRKDEIYLKEYDICKYIKEYISNSIYDYAIMIDGGWGSGKTYFVKNMFIPELEGHKKKIIKRCAKHKQKKCVYISLYGTNTIDELNKQIYINTYFNNEKKKRRFTFGSSAASLALDILKSKGLNLNQQNIKKFLGHFLSLDNIILIFDDLERCDCSINEIFGFVNTFMEHNHIKVIFIANEKEVIKNNKLFAFNSQEGMSEQKYYEQKEKVIGETIKYYATIEKSIKSVIEKANINEKLKSNINLQIFSIVYDSGYYTDNEINLRTIQFFLFKLNLMYSYFIDMNISNRDSLINNISYYLLIKCIEYKKNNKLNNFSNKIEYGETLYFDTYYRYIEYHCLDNFVINNKIDRESIEEMQSFFEHYYTKNHKENEQNKKIIYTLKNWKWMNDERIKKNLEDLLNSLKSNEYLLETYPIIIRTVLEMTCMGLDNIYLNTIIKYMIANIKNSQEFFVFPNEEIKDSEFDINYQYNEIIDELNMARGNNALKDHILKKAKNLNDYRQYFSELCIKKNNFSLFSNIDYNDFMIKLIKASPIDLYQFTTTFIEFYEDGENINALDFDKTYLKKMLHDLLNLKTNEFNLSQQYHFNKLQTFLKKIYPKIKKLENEKKELVSQYNKDFYELY